MPSRVSQYLRQRRQPAVILNIERLFFFSAKIKSIHRQMAPAGLQPVFRRHPDLCMALPITKPAVAKTGCPVQGSNKNKAKQRKSKQPPSRSSLFTVQIDNRHDNQPGRSQTESSDYIREPVGAEIQPGKTNAQNQKQRQGKGQPTPFW